METIESAFTKIGIGRFHVSFVGILGITYMFVALEMLIVAFLGPLLICSWRINVMEESLLTVAVFIGSAIGSVVFGRFSDRHGRKITLVIANTGLWYFGILSAFTSDVYWMIVFRFLVGIFIGANCPIFPYLSEVIPVKHRATVMILFPLFYTIGSLLLTSISIVTVESYGWRIFLGATAMPICLTVLAIFWLPESPRFLLLKTEKEICLQIINNIARMNKTDLIADIREPHVAESSYREAIHWKYSLTTYLTGFMWFVDGLTYYTLVLMITVFDSIPHKCLQNMSTYSTSDKYRDYLPIDDSCCPKITWASYRNIFVSTAGEMSFFILSFFLINSLGRKKTISFYTVVVLISLILLNLCLSSTTQAILLFFLRGSIEACFFVNYIYVSEVFPTSTRNFSVGVCIACSSAGSIIAPFFESLIVRKLSLMVGTMILVGLNIAVLICSFILPYETKNRKLYQTEDDEIND